MLKRSPWAIMILVVAAGIAAALWGYYNREKSVSIIDGGKKIEVKTFSTTVKDLLDEKNISVSAQDVVTPDISSKLSDGSIIYIKRAFEVKVIADGREVTVKTQPDTVENIVKKAGIKLKEKDKIQPSRTAYIERPADIKVIRIEEKVVEEIKKIPFKTVTRVDYNLPLGQKKLVQKGEEGQEKLITRIRLEDGKVVEKTTESVVVKPAKPEIVLKGGLTVASRGGVKFAYTKKLRMLATAYTHTGSPTALGTKPRVGVVAVDPKVIPLGTELYIDDYGFARAEDTGGSIKGDKIDLFFDTEAAARRFGRRWVTVYILKK
ncbi:3D domain-containing protein [Thermosediminibacter oceani]|uniref:3D domain protein n=1 Tax=Thermosediminibacter oceani (strain ATCC BAA-1034 / DSM 16646 / JW/IW-1228P) TaxID=555079 RepID=D9S2B7_THEOJ|nr:3D domain-containing protein [Thermosediminibacter oceani]ADL07544.1 3D domain protein [Thermosediminibacter oceani DSM 16646]